MTVDAASQAVFNWQRAIVVAASILLLAACSSQQFKPDTHESLNATLWSQSAAEYAASTTQAYHVATTNLELALADSQWTAALEQRGGYSGLPPAVLMDIDETVLDNSPYNARIIRQYGEYSQDTFSEWCKEAAAPAIPGAKDFVDHALERGVTIIYYSRRLESLRDCTTRNLEVLAFPLPDQKYLLLNNGLPATKKAQLRIQLSSQYRILLLVGDDMEDFVADSKSDPAARRSLSGEHTERWGREWIILPNPMYGSWETSLYGFDYELPRDERLDLKRQHLEQ
jgi:5'-nucleotidase (lipoprotein e(P4) family)